MNLETIEQRTLAYLRDSPRLIVPISEVLKMLDEDEDCQGMDQVRLLQFLREHELFVIVDPNDADKPHGAAMQSELGLLTEPGVSLTERIPSNDQVLASMADALDSMMKALETGTSQARSDSDPQRALRVQNILKRARELHEKMRITGLSKPQTDEKTK